MYRIQQAGLDWAPWQEIATVLFNLIMPITSNCNLAYKIGFDSFMMYNYDTKIGKQGVEHMIFTIVSIARHLKILANSPK